MKNIIVAIDAGKNSVKVKTGNTKFKFDNLVLQDLTEKKPSNNLSFEMKWNDQRFIIGNKVNTHINASSNKIIEFNKMAIYSAIAETMNRLKVDEATIQLITGLPNEHFNKDNETELSELLEIDNNQIVNLDGKDKNFIITDLLVAPENFSVDYEDVPRTLLLDLGFRNVNINVLEGGDLTQTNMKHSELGILEMKNRIIREIQNKTKECFKLQDISDYIVINGFPQIEDSKKIIDSAIIKYFQDIKNDLAIKGIKLDTVNTIAFRGGGTKLFKLDHLKEVFPNHFTTGNCIIEGDEYKNVEIFEAIALDIFGDDGDAN